MQEALSQGWLNAEQSQGLGQCYDVTLALASQVENAGSLRQLQLSVHGVEQSLFRVVVEMGAKKVVPERTVIFGIK